MNKSIIAIFIGTFFLIGGLIWFGQPTGNTETEAAAGVPNTVLITEESSFDFGSISMANGKVTHKFKVKNTGAEDVNLKKLYTSCMCTEANLLLGDKKYGPFGMPGHVSVSLNKVNIAPNQEAEVEVIFDPAAHGPAGVGLIERVVTLENSAGSPVEFSFSAKVTP